MAPMKMVITIDTEEDNWRPFSSQPTTRNAQAIPALQELFEKYNATPTYLLTYDMANDDGLIDFLTGCQAQNHCEIGAHCHPWNTPPHAEVPHLRNSMLTNLPADLVDAKLTSLHELLVERTGRSPVTFRSGRWGYGEQVAKTLFRLGYKAETSVTAHTDWTESFGPDYSQIGPKPYLFNPDGIYEPNPKGKMAQIPATTGYLQSRFERCARIEKWVREGPGRHLRLLGIFDRLGLLNKVALSPEISDLKSMIKLTRVMKHQGYRCLNLFFHSPTLVPGLTPFVRNHRDKTAFLLRIEGVLRFASEYGIEIVGTGQLANELLAASDGRVQRPEAVAEKPRAAIGA